MHLDLPELPPHCDSKLIDGSLSSLHVVLETMLAAQELYRGLRKQVKRRDTWNNHIANQGYKYTSRVPRTAQVMHAAKVPDRQHLVQQIASTQRVMSPLK